MIVDGPYDGGVDILLSDPNTEGADLVIGQSKFYTSIQYDDVLNAMTKMALFYKDMIRGQYEQVNPTVQRRFMTLLSDIGDESKIRFVFYTSAPQSGIHRDRIEKNSASSSQKPTTSKCPFCSQMILWTRSRNPSPGARPWKPEKSKLIKEVTSCFMATGRRLSTFPPFP